MAGELCDAFSDVCGVSCRVTAADGRTLHQSGADLCASCPRFHREECGTLHADAIWHAERFGGRYIYICPRELMFCVCPVMADGRVTGALSCGPISVGNEEESADTVPEGDWKALPSMEPARLSRLSYQLFADSICISDTSRAMLLSQAGEQQQSAINIYLQEIKEQLGDTPYPLERERAMSAAVTQGDGKTAHLLLNELLGHVFYCAGSREAVTTRLYQLLTVIARAATDGGAEEEQVFLESVLRCRALTMLTGQKKISLWMSDTLDSFLRLLPHKGDGEQTREIRRAVAYLRQNYAEKVTLAEAAEKAGFSPSYFSRQFRAEMGINFQQYINVLRIDASKPLLLGNKLTIAEISSRVGFEDQSYFGRVFKRLTGVTPDRYRHYTHRIDSEKEYGG